MSFTVQWLIEGQVLLIQNHRVLSLDEVHAQNDELFGYIDTARNNIHLIVDNRELKQVPRNVQQIELATQVLKHPSIGWVIEISSHSSMIQLLMTLLIRVMRVPYKRVTNYEDAIHFLRGEAPGLDWA